MPVEHGIRKCREQVRVRESTPAIKQRNLARFSDQHTVNTYNFANSTELPYMHD
jgi:hypothetical protein